MAIRVEDFEAANRRAEMRLAETPHALAAHFDPLSGRVTLELNTGLHLSFRACDAQGLAHAGPDDLKDIEISPTGLGLHFPALDADLYLPALLEGFLGSKNWMARAMGQRGGSRLSSAKAAAARANGRLGGRPPATSNRKSEKAAL
jgi:Protein of unknown function (DUF2442)